jgi:hypothetical protein
MAACLLILDAPNSARLLKLVKRIETRDNDSPDDYNSFSSAGPLKTAYSRIQ